MVMGAGCFVGGGGGGVGGVTSNGTQVTSLAFPAGIGTWATVALNAGGTANLFQGGSNTNAADTWIIGDPANLSSILLKSLTTTAMLGASCYMRPANNSTDWVKCNANGIGGAIPFAGHDSGIPLQFKRAAIAIAGNLTLSAAQASSMILDLTNGGVAAGFTLTVPGTNNGATYRIFNGTGQICTVSSGGTTAAVPAASNRDVVCDGANNWKLF